MARIADRICLCCLLPFGIPSPLRAQEAVPPSTVTVPLSVPAGAPLRLYLTSRVPLRIGQPVQAKLIEPVYAFDRVVIPAGADVQGQITALRPVLKRDRAKAVAGGDFTPLRTALIRFTSVRLPDGRRLPVQTADAQRLFSFYSPTLAGKKQQPIAKTNPPGKLTAAKQQLKDRLNARTRSVIDVVRGPNKKEYLTDYLLSKLPYHPQWVRRHTRFDAVLQAPLDFGQATLALNTLQQIGSDPAPDSVAHVRLLSAFTSGDAQIGQPISGVLSEPLFSANHELVLPAGTAVTGAIRQVRPARWFHRGGQLRFTFDRLAPPPIAELRQQPVPRTTMTQLVAAETETAQAMAKVKVDEEGTAKATESKKRLLGPALALIAASRALDNDAGHHARGTGGTDGNYGGRAAGGFSGFGLLGSIASRSSQTVGSVLGVYGLASSVYSTIISRGQEVEFRQNAPVEIRFTPRSKPAPGI